MVIAKQNGRRADKDKTKWPPGRLGQNKMAAKMVLAKQNGRRADKDKSKWPPGRLRQNKMAAKMVLAKQNGRRAGTCHEGEGAQSHFLK